MAISIQRWNVLLALLLSITNLNNSDAFASPRTAFSCSTPTIKPLAKSTRLYETDETTNSDENKSLSFDDATQQLKEEEDSIKAAQRGLMMEEDAKNFEEKRETYNAMRDKIRSRATDLNMNKSVATQEAIKAATQRAAAGEQAATPTVDLSKFNSALLTEPEDELTKEQMADIDKVGQMSLPDQIMEEVKNTKFPSPDATLKQAGLMLVIFLVTAGVILKVDEFLRFQYTDWGFIPKSGEVLDYSDLSLPEGFTDMMTDGDLTDL